MRVCFANVYDFKMFFVAFRNLFFVSFKSFFIEHSEFKTAVLTEMKHLDTSKQGQIVQLTILDRSGWFYVQFLRPGELLFESSINGFSDLIDSKLQ